MKNNLQQYLTTFLLILIAAASAFGQLKSIDDAEELARKTGRPIFAVAGQET